MDAPEESLHAPEEPLGEVFGSVLEAARAGADWAWTAIYRDLAPSVLRYLRARRVPDAEDVLGEVFVRVVRNIGSFEGTHEELRAWVFTIARNRLIDDSRRNARRGVDVVPDDVLVDRAADVDVEQEAMRSLADSEVRHVIERLTPDQRDVLLLRFFGRLTAAEVGRVLGKKTGAVKTLQVRALAAVRRELAKEAVSR